VNAKPQTYVLMPEAGRILGLRRKPKHEQMDDRRNPTRRPRAAKEKPLLVKRKLPPVSADSGHEEHFLGARGDVSTPCRCFSSVVLGMLAGTRISGLYLNGRANRDKLPYFPDLSVGNRDAAVRPVDVVLERACQANYFSTPWIMIAPPGSTPA
jgi:hypothetical protein